MNEIEDLARRMYEEQENQVIPGWESLTGGCRELWLERAQAVLFEDLA